jgi:L,D-transpeptidase catalytic domain
MKLMRVITLIIMILLIESAWAYKRYGEIICQDPDYLCLKIKKGQSWENLFPVLEIRDIMQRINRMNVRLKAGSIIAIPKNLDRLTIYDVSPFPRYIEPSGEKIIYISQQKLAWGAYDERGELLWWGPISSGADKCRAVIGGCATPTGSYRIIRKQDIDCISTAFPRRFQGDNGGALMPYCMHFYQGYALHGSEEVPGYRASHGCIRMFTEDARWLNEEFVDLPGGGMKGTRVVVDEVNK